MCYHRFTILWRAPNGLSKNTPVATLTAEILVLECCNIQYSGMKRYEMVDVVMEQFKTDMIVVAKPAAQAKPKPKPKAAAKEMLVASFLRCDCMC